MTKPPLQTTCGLGACAALGMTSCDEGVELDSCSPGEPTGCDEVTCPGNGTSHGALGALSLFGPLAIRARDAGRRATDRPHLWAQNSHAPADAP